MDKITDEKATINKLRTNDTTHKAIDKMMNELRIMIRTIRPQKVKNAQQEKKIPVKRKKRYKYS